MTPFVARKKQKIIWVQANGGENHLPQAFLHPSAILWKARLASYTRLSINHGISDPSFHCFYTSHLDAFAITISFSGAGWIAKFASSPSFGTFLHHYTCTTKEDGKLCLANTKGSPYVSNTAACAEYTGVSRHCLDLAGGQYCSNLQCHGIIRKFTFLFVSSC